MAHVSLITLGVEDLDRAARFYVGLGWEPSSASVEDTIVFLRGGAVVLALFGRHDLATEAGLPPAAPSGASMALAMNVATEDEVEETVDAAVRAGGWIARPGRRADWGGYSAYVTDPDGHLWEIAHNPMFPLDADGRITLPDDG
jgi:uncharacterized protein